MVGAFTPVEIRVEPDRIMIKVDTDLRTIATETTTLESFKFPVGSVVNQPVVAEAHFDDVVCRKE